MPPSLTIVIPSHNRADLLRLCLASVRCHAPPDTEILVVDDASPNRCATRTASEFSGVSSLRFENQRGFCAAVNAGIRAAHRPIVELLNDDTEVTAGWADTALAHFADPSVAAVAPLVLKGTPRDNHFVIDSAGDRYYLGGIAGKRGHGQALDPRYLQSGGVFGVSASSAFYRRETLLQIGGFPEDFVAYFEDVDVSFRLHWAGHRLIYEPTSRVWHRVSASHGKPNRRLLEQQSRNEERVFWRNLPKADLVRALPWHVAVLAAKALRRWHEGALLPFVLGRLRILVESPHIFLHRRRLQRTNALASCASWGVESDYWGRSEHPPLLTD